MSTYTTLSKAVTVDTLDAWILDSAAGSLDRPQIRLLPEFILPYLNKLKPHTFVHGLNVCGEPFLAEWLDHHDSENRGLRFQKNRDPEYRELPAEGKPSAPADEDLD